MKRKINDNFQYYRNEYLKSDHWKNLRDKKLKEANFCYKCCSKSNLDVHHLQYKQLYNVLMSDLRVVCRRCHKKIHDKINQRKQEKFLIANVRKIKQYNKRIIKRVAKTINIKPGLLIEILKINQIVSFDYRIVTNN